MPMRPSSDRPINDPLSRAGFVQKQDIDGDASLGIVAFPGYGRQPAENSISQRSRVRSRWQQEAGVWTGLNRPANVSDEVLVDGREGASGQPGENGEFPAVGWSTTVAGFNARFPEAQYKADYPDARIVVAFHPTGLAVAIGQLSDGTIELYEWIPGVGFGKKYPTMRPGSIDAVLNAHPFYGAAYTTVHITLFAGRIAFSHDGAWFAVAGTGKDVAGIDTPIEVWSVSLENGFDLYNPVVSSDAGSLGATVGDEGRSLAWSNDDRWIVLGCGFPAATDSLAVVSFSPFQGGYLAGTVNYPATQSAGVSPLLALSPDGEWLLVGTRGGFALGGTSESAVIYPFDQSTGVLGTPVSGFTTVDDEIHGIAWLPDGLHFLYMNGYDDGGTDYGLFSAAFNPAGGGSVSGVTKHGDLSAWQSTLGMGLNPAGTTLVIIGQSPTGPGFDSLAALYSVNPATGVPTFVAQTSWKYENPWVEADVKFRPGAA